MILGQAPGALEGAERRPWRGRAGRTLRGWLELDEEAFYATFYCASITRCYPGRHRPAGGPDADAARGRALPFLARVGATAPAPPLVVPVGGLALRALLGPTA